VDSSTRANGQQDKGLWTAGQGPVNSSTRAALPHEFEELMNKERVDMCPPMQVFTSVSTKRKGYQQKEKRSKKEKVET
jgi:hypothetical protein